MATKSNLPENSRTGTAISPTPFNMMLRAMANDASADDGQFTGDDLNAILGAQTEEEMWEADERPPLNFQHLASCQIAVLDFDVKYSRGGKDGIITPFVTPEGKKMYILASCTRLGGGKTQIFKLPEVGEVFQANTSARYVVAKLWRAMTMGLINPSTGKALHCMVQETDLGDGQAVLKLRPITMQRTTPSSAE